MIIAEICAQKRKAWLSFTLVKFSTEKMVRSTGLEPVTLSLEVQPLSQLNQPLR